MSTPKHTPGPWSTFGPVKYQVYGGDPVRRIAVVDYTTGSGTEEHNANATLIAAAPAMYKTIQHLLEWAKGNRGAKTGNPYCIPEVRHALKTLASIQGVKDYLDVDTTVEGGL